MPNPVPVRGNHDRHRGESAYAEGLFLFSLFDPNPTANLGGIPAKKANFCALQFAQGLALEASKREVTLLRKVSLVAAMALVLLLNCVSVYAATTEKGTPANKASQAKTAPTLPAPPVKPAADKVAPEQQQQPVAPEYVIKFGDRGDDVKKVQKLLADTGFYADDVDGIFGSVTLAAVKEFQSVNGLPVDGTVGKTSIAYLERSNTEPSRYNRTLTMTATAYTRFDDGCGNYTSRGHLLRKGLVAVDPNVIPMGTRLYIPGYGYAIADDIGGAIKGNKIDLAFESLSDAYQFGRQKITVYILD